MSKKKATSKLASNTNKVTKKKTSKKVGQKKTTTKKASSKKNVVIKAPEKKKAGRPKGSKNKSKPVVQREEIIVEQKEEVVEKKSTLFVDDRPAEWILSSGMHFGLVNKGFAVGTRFTVDWANRQMRCESDGIIYENIKDLEIAIRLGSAEPYGEEDGEGYQKQQEIQRMAQEHRLTQIQQSRKQRDEEVRHMINQSDRDVMTDIDIGDTRRGRKTDSTPTHVTASSEVSVLKPQAPTQMEIHYSDSPQDGKVIRSSNEATVRGVVSNTSTNAKPLSPVLSGTNVWDATKGGSIESDIRKKLSDYSIKVDENGQQYIRGLPVIRDDSEASGPSRNEGSVISMTKEQLAQRSHKIEHIRSSKKQEVASNRQKGGQAVQDNNVINNPTMPRGPDMDVSSFTPQELIPGMGVSDKGVEQIERTVVPISEIKKKSGTAGKLLRRKRR